MGESIVFFFLIFIFYINIFFRPILPPSVCVCVCLCVCAWLITVVGLGLDSSDRGGRPALPKLDEDDCEGDDEEHEDVDGDKSERDDDDDVRSFHHA